MMKEQLPEGVLILQLFGMSEASGYVTFTFPDRNESHRLQTNGTPIEGVEIRIVDPETCAVLPAGQEGEIQFRGPNSFHSYYEDERATRATILPGGWIRTGDCGRIDAEGSPTFWAGSRTCSRLAERMWLRPRSRLFSGGIRR